MSLNWEFNCKLLGDKELPIGTAVALGGSSLDSPVSRDDTMPRLGLFRSLGTLVIAFAIASCSDASLLNPTAPPESSSSVWRSTDGLSVAMGKHDKDLRLAAVRWAWHVKENRIKGEHHKKYASKVKQVIGPAGGTISLPDRGFTMVFPAGAVAAPVQIEVVSDKKYVAYTMKPSGTVFLKDVIVTQQLKPTALKLDMMRDELHAAFIGDSVQLSHSVPILELQPSKTIFSTTPPFLPEAHVWIIRHFSRYMLASG